MEEEKVVPTEEVAQEEVKEEVKEEPKPEETTEEVVVEETPPPKKKTAQERFDELTRKRRDAEREAEFWKAKALQKEQEAKPEAPSAPDIPKRPTLDQFETTEQYEDALFEWRDKVRDIKTQSKTREEQLNSAYRTYEQRAAKAREAYEDYDEAVNQTPYTETMRVALWKTEQGPELAYYIATHPADGDRIRSLPSDEQLIEIGRLETKLILAKQTKKVTSAPAPPTPVGMAGGAKEIDRSALPINEWMALEKKEQIEKAKKKFGIT